MFFIDSEMLDLGCAALGWQASDLQLHFGWRSGDVIIVIVPNEYENLVSIATGQSRDIGLAANSVFENRSERDRVVALHSQTLSGHFAEHAEYVQHGLVDAVGGERSE